MRQLEHWYVWIRFYSIVCDKARTSPQISRCVIQWLFSQITWLWRFPLQHVWVSLQRYVLSLIIIVWYSVSRKGKHPETPHSPSDFSSWILCGLNCRLCPLKIQMNVMLSKIKHMRLNECIIWISSEVIGVRLGTADWEVALSKTDRMWGNPPRDWQPRREHASSYTVAFPGSLRQKWKPLEKLFYQSSRILSCSLTSTLRNSLHWDVLSYLTAFVFMIVLFHCFAFFFLWGSPSFILPMGFLLWDANTVLSCLDISKLTAWNFFSAFG